MGGGQEGSNGMTRRLIGVAVSAALGSLTGVVAGSMYNSRREPAVSSTAIFISQPDVSNMRCKPVREVGGQSTHIAERCENDEVVCYESPNGLACQFKEAAEFSSSGDVTIDPDGTVTIRPDAKPPASQFYVPNGGGSTFSLPLGPNTTPSHIGI